MKRTIILTVVAAASLIATAFAFAGDSESAEKMPQSQTHCPVMGGVIDSTVFTDIQGQRVYHCCPMCSDVLKADPDKYFKRAGAQNIVFENIQTTCPVSGKELSEKQVYTDYQGRRVYFCCEKCIAEFDKDPADYLSRLDGLSPQKDSPRKSDDSTSEHQDHMH